MVNGNLYEVFHIEILHAMVQKSLRSHAYFSRYSPCAQQCSATAIFSESTCVLRSILTYYVEVYVRALTPTYYVRLCEYVSWLSSTKLYIGCMGVAHLVAKFKLFQWCPDLYFHTCFSWGFYPCRQTFFCSVCRQIFRVHDVRLRKLCSIGNTTTLTLPLMMYGLISSI